MRGLYYNKEGERIDSVTWARLMEDEKYRVIKQLKSKDNIFISLVWLGLDHGFGEGDPLIFEVLYKKADDPNWDEASIERFSSMEAGLFRFRQLELLYNRKTRMESLAEEL